MRVATWCAMGAMAALAACSSAQPVPVKGDDLGKMLSGGAEVTSGTSTMTFFNDKTVSRRTEGSDAIADGTWRIDGDKLCITWKSPAAPEACATQMKVGDHYEAVGPDGKVMMSYMMK